jgi:predicted ArsR family transcriptional regulator
MLFYQDMVKIKEENPTRKKIILLLKKSGGMGTEQLSKALGITPMGIRQHLVALEKKGFVTYDTRRQGIGRPGFIYKLTDEAEDLFPKQYDTLLLEILDELEKREGRPKVEELFRWRKDRLLKDIKGRIDNTSPLSEKVSHISDMLSKEGYFTEVVDNGDRYLLKQYNCPISVVSKKYYECCKYELAMYRELLEADIAKEECISEGATACVFSIAKVK